ncbi:anosmin-1a isoform X1 [Xyrichtys novacula]|uniref:Anosmin-1a isoform X1 n=1 Tax=Xyrichtys novacula TaxID=13765 RepID=A0AAV1HR00_XYRNO|nr:anosmin-1a isoform X1 [Xyrichtys novacula]
MLCDHAALQPLSILTLRCPPRSLSSSLGFIVALKLDLHQITPRSILFVSQSCNKKNKKEMQFTRVPLPSLSLWIILLLSSGVDARKQRDEGDDEESWSESVSRARCASRCLSLHSVEALSVSTPLQNNGSLGWCQHHKQCAKCLEPCKDSWEMKRKSNCRELCERVFPKKHWECVTSCEFLQSVLAVKQGSCPPPEKASGFAAACVESCDHDRDCSTLKKCCSNGCGHTCQTPKDLYKGAPLKPRKELGFAELPSGQLEVRWSSRFNISAEPVVYVLQRRWNFGIQPSEDSATSWQVVAQTTEQGARLSDIRPGRWYQFRVAAVNTHGTRGFTTPSRHIHSRRDPSNPPAPSELRVANMSFGPGRAVSARLLWSVPSDLDVPVHHYKVSWSWTAAGQQSASSLTKRRKTVRESQVELDSMRANRSYSVEVQAVSYWGQTQLKGPRAILHFSTQRAFSSVPRNPTGDILDVGTPFYQDGQLRVHVYWQSSTDPSVEYYRVEWGPEHCAHNQTRPTEKTNVRESFVSLQGLLFSCKYKVLLQPLSQKTRPPAESTVFFTPSCATIQAKSPKPITCFTEKAPTHKVLVKPINLTAAFEVRGGNMTAIFSWDLSPPPYYQQLTGYQVTWAEVIQTNRPNSNKLPHSLISQSQILPPEANVLVVTDLHPDSLYRLEVQAITAEGEGPAASRTFQTPGNQSTLRHRPRLRKLHQNMPIIERH